MTSSVIRVVFMAGLGSGEELFYGNRWAGSQIFLLVKGGGLGTERVWPGEPERKNGVPSLRIEPREARRYGRACLMNTF